MRETGGREKEMDIEIEMGGLTGRVSNQTDGRERLREMGLIETRESWRCREMDFVNFDKSFFPFFSSIFKKILQFQLISHCSQWIGRLSMFTNLTY